MFVGVLALLTAAFRPMVGATSTEPGGFVLLKDGLLYVRPGGPLSRAGAQNADRFVQGETVELGGTKTDPLRALRWKGGIPRSGKVEVKRSGKSQWLTIRPAPPAWPVRLAWSLVGLLNTALAALALALFWQRPQDGRAVLLGLVLMAAPVFAFPREPRLATLALAAHFFAIFPPPALPLGRRAECLRAVRIYLPFIVLGFLGAAMWEDGDRKGAAFLFNLLAVGYALFGLRKVLSRWKGATEADRPVVRTLTVAAGAILLAVLLGISQHWWVISDQFIPAHLLPAALFSAAVGHLVFRLRALEVRVMARRTLQYLLARWTLGTLFLIPGFVLVWRFGQLSVKPDGGGSGDAFPYLLWMFIVAVLSGKRQEVLQRLDRRFFRDVEATRVALIQLAHDLGEQTTAEGVYGTLDRGVRQALDPVSVQIAPPEAAPAKGLEERIPIHRGERLLGYLELGPKRNGEAYSSEERRLLGSAAVQAAVALENARLSAALLEQQRTELAARTAGVLAGAEEERRRLAADLHDQVLPELRQIAGDVERLQRNANGLAPELARLEGEIRGTMDSVREVMEALRPSALDMLGLTAALESYVRNCASRQEPPVAVIVRRKGEEPVLSPDQSLALYRICQEAVNNILKHSGTRSILLEVDAGEEALSITMTDRGCGFDVERCLGTGHGLLNIRYRADLIGAQVEWRRLEPEGTAFAVTLPLVESAK